MKKMRIGSALLAAMVLVTACAGKKLNSLGDVKSDGSDGGGTNSAAGGRSSDSGGKGAGGKGAGGKGTKPALNLGGAGEAGYGSVDPSIACSDGVLDDGESDVDCGGPDCPSCQEGQHCGGGDDCQSHECGGHFDNDTCEPLHCGNHALDLDEGDVDCGGKDCDRCEDGQLCTLNEDCLSSACRNGVCVRACRDEQDCGVSGACQGGQCVYCTDSDQCSSVISCGSVPTFEVACRAGTCTCVQSSCDNGVEEGDESDIDCGGTSCEPCANGKGCDLAEDCESGVCTATFEDSVFHCYAEQCDNHVLDDGETDVDCGGPECPKCDQGAGCLVEDDCQYRFNCDNNVCVRRCNPQGANTCDLGSCVVDRCVECETVENCAINCGIYSEPACHNGICQCVFK